MKFHLISLGCSKNTVDSEGVISDFVQQGWEWSPEANQADLVLLNTCGFIKDAKEESLKHIFQLVKLKKERPQTRIAVFGCLVQRYQEALRRDIPEIDHLFNFFQKSSFSTLLRGMALRTDNGIPKALPQRILTPPHLGFLKIAEGCSNKCSYCTIPQIRGPFQPRPMDDILKDVETLVMTGAKEISIIAQDTARFGSALGEPHLLLDLIRKIGKYSEVHWIRLHYLHPKYLEFDFLDSLFSLPKVIPYFDIPLQHVSDKILSLMNRGGTKKEVIRLVRHIRRVFKGAVLRTTFIVGFPGETEEDFQELIEFIDNFPVDRLGAFPYSPEKGTPSFKIRPRVNKKEKTRRMDELMMLQQLHNLDDNNQKIGNVTEILIDKIENNEAIGRTFGDAFEVDNSVIVPYDGSFSPGDFLKVRIIDAEAYDLKGEKV